MRPDVFNTHIHLPPNFSAFDSVDDALDQAATESCALLGTSNYYDFRVYEPFVKSARERGIYPTLGLEILCRDGDAATRGDRYNDPGNPGKVYLCGKGLTAWREPSEKAKAILDRIREADARRIDEMARRLKEHFGGGSSAEEIRAVVAREAGVPEDAVVLQERHLAKAYATSGLDLERAFGEAPKSHDPVALQNEVRTRLMKSGKPAFVAESYVSLEEGVELVQALGGLPSYPFLVDGVDPVCEMERDLGSLIARLRELGIGFAEFIPNRNAPEKLREYVIALWEAGFPVTAGTEHNTSERLPLRPRCKDCSPIPDDVQEIFWRSACIVAGHEQGATGDLESLRKAGEEAIWTYRN